MVTCYDYTFARLLSQSAIDAILIGDSAAMVMHGHSSTINAELELMRFHTAAVARGAADKFLVADMPFLSFRKGISAALDTAHQLMRAGAHAVKLEGVAGHDDVIEAMTQSGIPVMGHLGLQPQSVHAYGGYKVQGRSEEQAKEILRQARLLQHTGAFAVVLECIPTCLAKEITQELAIPTIGIGAGPHCDGQILVLQDMLGMNLDFQPKFVRTFAQTGRSVIDALDEYNTAVKQGSFPSREESYS